jgi:hypothetical protein
MLPDLIRCAQEIAEARALLLAGAPHERELLIWYADWWLEAALIHAEFAGLRQEVRDAA